MVFCGVKAAAQDCPTHNSAVVSVSDMARCSFNICWRISVLALSLQSLSCVHGFVETGVSCSEYSQNVVPSGPLASVAGALALPAYRKNLLTPGAKKIALYPLLRRRGLE